MDFLRAAWERAREWALYPLFPLGSTHVSAWTLLYVFGLLAALIWLTSLLRTWMLRRVLAKGYVEAGTRDAVATLIRYVLMGVGAVVVLSTAGIDLSSLTVLAGALGIGVGFGLQHLVANMVSGFVILVARPIKLGDRIEVGQVRGEVISISLRSTTVLTNDHIAIIVPNSEFTTSKVVNWSYMDRDVRLHVPVGVAYGSDPEAVKAALLEAAHENPSVLGEPGPDVLLDGFGESALQFDLRVWTRDHSGKPGALRSQLNFAILKKFQERGIRIPFPRRDVRIVPPEPGLGEGGA